MEELVGLFEFVGGVAEFVSNVAGDFFNGDGGEVAEIVVDLADFGGSDAPPSPDEEERRRRLIQDSLNRPAS